MMTEDTREVDAIIRHISKSEAIHVGIHCPYWMSDVRACRVGFASIPVLRVEVLSPEEPGALVPVVRQYVFQTVENIVKVLGFDKTTPSDWVEYRPLVSDHCRMRFFIDENPDSRTLGKRKRGRVYSYSFEIRRNVEAFKALPRSYEGSAL